MRSIIPVVMACLACLAAIGVPAAAQGEVTVDPPAVTGTLAPGETEGIQVSVSLPGSIPRGDVVFVFDTTGSLYQVLDAMKAQGIQVMQQIREAIPDTRFGVASFMDYPVSYTSFHGYTCKSGTEIVPCIYGDPGAGDYDYRMDENLTADISIASAAINDIPAGSGGDWPQDYSRAIYESQFFSWDEGAKKILVIFGDAPPHAAPGGATLQKPWDTGYLFTHTEYGAPYGGDPGRDQVAYTEDDLDYELVIRDAAEQHISIVGIYCPEGGMLDEMHSDAENNFRYMAHVTGGAFVLSNSAGDPSEITSQIVSIIQQMSTENVGELSLQAGEEAYRGWVASPDTYTDVPWPSTRAFNVDITPPAGTPGGEYSFPLSVVGDGVVLGTVAVTIHVSDVPATGFIHITSDPAGATIILDRVNTGILTGHTFDGISPGPHTVNVTLAGYKIATEQTVNVVAGAKAEASFILVREQVPEPAEVRIDIRPGNCPNSFNPKEKGVLPVAILGSRELKASEIDPKSIVLTREGGVEGVKPIRSSIADVASASTKTCSCGFKSGRPDRKQDLNLKFDSQELVKKLGIGDSEGCVRVTITGTLRSSDPKVNGQVITGSDYLRVLRTGHGPCGNGDPEDKEGSCDKGGSCDNKGSDNGRSCDKGGSCDGGWSAGGEEHGDEGNPWDDDSPSEHGRGNGRGS